MTTLSKISAFGAQMVDLRVAAADRLLDAEVLLSGGRFASAIVMGTYALEITLKALICKRLDLTALPKAFEIHELNGLLVLSGLQAPLQSAPPLVKKNWSDVVSQSASINDMRYMPSRNWPESQALTFLGQLRDPPDGVLPWLLAQP
jgi:hypothetical protein